MYLDINTLPEIISRENYLFLLNDLLKNTCNLSKYTVLRHLDTLGDKLDKFENNVLCKNQKDIIYMLMLEYTDFNSLDLMENLNGIMFQFRIDKYVEYLKVNIDSIRSEKVYAEVFEAINEYE